MSNMVATQKEHTRYMYEEPDYDQITFPVYDDLIKDAGILTFENIYPGGLANITMPIIIPEGIYYTRWFTGAEQ